jgi:uncharacterized membrane protein HdeD (DUF308 family)
VRERIGLSGVWQELEEFAMTESQIPSTNPPVQPSRPTSPHNLGAGIEALRGKWGWIVALGVLFAIAGVIALGSVITATVVSVLFVGAMMVVAGIGEIIHAFAIRSWGRFALWLLLGALYVVAGISVYVNPLLAASFLTLILGAALVASGLLRIVIAFQMRSGTPWGWVVLSGVITLLLGGIILMHWPASSLFVLGVLLGVDLLFIGFGWILVGLALRARAGR